jgi:hypothetical protein
MQEDINSAGMWCENNDMELNARKCKVMDITRAHKIDENKEFLHPTYEIGGIKLGCVGTERLLGVHITKDLTQMESPYRGGAQKSGANFGVCTTQPEGLYAHD